MSRWRISDVMTVDVASVREDAPFREIVALLEQRRVRAVPVVDGYGTVVGVVSESDLLPKVEFAGGLEPLRLFEGRQRRIAWEKARGDVARELMTTPAVTMPANMSIVDAARVMDLAGVKQLLVVDQQDRLVGIVAACDLLKVFLRADEAIRDDVLGELRKLPGVEPWQVQVSVNRGVVTMTGQLDHKSLLPLTVGLARRTDGVVDVVSRLSYLHDDTDPVRLDAR